MYFLTGIPDNCEFLVNFSPDLSEAIQEAKYLEKLGYNVPDLVRSLALQEDKFCVLSRLSWTLPPEVPLSHCSVVRGRGEDQSITKNVTVSFILCMNFQLLYCINYTCTCTGACEVMQYLVYCTCHFHLLRKSC